MKESNVEKKAVIYTRVSSKQQMEEWDWLRGQERLCKQRAESSNIKIVKVFSDWWKSWKYEATQSREWLSDMIEFLTTKNKDYTKIHLVIIDDMDRLTRDVQARREIKAQIEWLWGAEIYSLKQKIEDTPEWKMIQSITMSVKQYQREANARQVKDKQRARMLNWYRPLYSPPWYEHKKSKWEWKILIKTEYAEIIKEWLILFSDWMLDTQTDLMDFMNTKWFQTRRGNKCNLEFIRRLLERERLLFYAGFIHYPPRDVSMVDWNHESLIRIDVVEKVLHRLNPKPYYQKSSKSEIWLKLPLRWFLYDLKSWKKYTWWPSQWKKELYFYYSVKTPQENWKKTFSIDHNELHAKFFTYLKQFKIDDTTLILFEETMKTVRSKKSSTSEALIKDMEKRVAEIDKEKKKLVKLATKSKTDEMVEEYENEIITLKDEQATIKLKIERSKEDDFIDIKKIISNTKTILKNPSFIRELWNIQLQKMLIWLLFNNKIYFDKKSGFQTPEIPLIYKHLSSFSTNSSWDLEVQSFFLNQKIIDINWIKVTIRKTWLLGMHLMESWNYEVLNKYQ